LGKKRPLRTGARKMGKLNGGKVGLFRKFPGQGRGIGNAHQGGPRCRGKAGECQKKEKT